MAAVAAVAPSAEERQVKVASPVLLAPAQKAQATFALEFLGDDCCECPMIYLKPSLSSARSKGITSFAIGRSHQQKAFEAWVPDQALQCCISRTAFEPCS